MTEPGIDGAASGAAAELAQLRRVEAALDARTPAGIVPDLSRITALVDLLGSPQRAYPSIHITGTNGKTSTSRMIDALLRAFGLRTGRYTSPHLESITERIALSGEQISAGRLAETYDQIEPFLAMVDERSDQRLTYFEAMTALAFAAFADAPVDVAVVEVGLGGRWDATNVLEAPVCVVTPISIDHAEYLGDTVEAIAAEKAGIIHRGALVITAQQPLGAATELLRRAVETDTTVAREGLEFGVTSRAVAVGGQMLTLQGLGGGYEDLFLPLHGAHQASNAACALAAVEAFLGGGRGALDIDAVRAGFASVDSPGRMERVRKSPTILLDAAHNPDGARALAAGLVEAFDFRRLAVVLAVLDDKDATGIVEALEPVADVVIVTRNSSPRAMDVDELAAVAVGIFGADRVEVAPRLDVALDIAVAAADEGDALGGSGVVVTGSVVTVGDARHLLARPR